MQLSHTVMQFLQTSVQRLHNFLHLRPQLPSFAATIRTKMAKRKKVLISNNSVNAYGFRILTEGIDLTQYRRNPILLFMHRRPSGPDSPLPLGVVEDLEVVDGALYGTPVIKAVDDFSRKIEQQWDEDVLKMVSGEFEAVEWSEDPAVLVAGQTRPTLTRCRLIEVSIVDIGANDDALRLVSGGQSVRLSMTGECDIPLIKTNKNEKKMEDLKKIALALGLDSGAGETEILDAIKAAQSDRTSLEAVQAELASVRLAAVKDAVENAVKDGRIDEKSREDFVQLGKTMGVEFLSRTLGAMRAVPAGGVRPSAVIGGNAPSQKEYTRLSEVPEDAVRQMRSEQPDEYRRLYRAEYGFDCQI